MKILVAIRENLPESNMDEEESDAPLNSSSNSLSSFSFTDRLKQLANYAKAGLGVGVSGAETGADERKPDSLRCSMTYVNVPWPSITQDLLHYAQKLKSPSS
jgi:hypothetical protein